MSIKQRKKIFVALIVLAVMFTSIMPAAGYRAFAEQGTKIESEYFAVSVVDNSTDLENGTYSASDFSIEFFGGTGKAKWSCDTLRVEGGKAFATFKINSTSYTHVYTGFASGNSDEEMEDKYDPTTDVMGEGVYAINSKTVEIPVNLNKLTHFAGRSTAMSEPHWIRYAYEIKITKPEPEPDPQEPEPQNPEEDPSEEKTPYTIDNKTNMFKGIDAYMMSENGKETLYLTLSGEGYHYIFKGSYDDAVATGDDSSKWIAGNQRTDEGEFKDKWQFAIPVEGGETLIPIQTLSHSHQQQGHGNWWYPRYVKVDRENKVIETGEYVDEKILTIDNKVKMFKPTGAVLKTTGGPHSNKYKKELELTMGSAAFDKAYVGVKAEAEAATDTVEFADSKFVFLVEKIQGKGVNGKILKFIGKDTVISFHSAKNDKWYERKFTLDEANALLTIEEVNENDPVVPTPNPDPQPEEVPSISAPDSLNKDNALTIKENGVPQYTKGESKGLVIEIKNIDLKRLVSVSVDGNLLKRNSDYVATQGSIRISFSKEYLDKLSAGEHKTEIITTKGEFTQSFLIAEGNAKPEEKKAVNTGDASSAMLYAVLLLSSLAAVYATKKTYMRNK